MATTLINVSNRLPVTVGDTITKSSGGLVAALEGLSKEEYDTRWIGWPGGAIAQDKQAEVERTLVEEHGCTPVFLTKEEADGHYEGFSNSSVWPLLHYMPNYLRYEPEWWQMYRDINQRFADKVLENAKEGDLVWVHDYQLLLLPAMLRKAMPKLRIGFFLHTPFPAFDIFRCHPRRRELVEGMLGADLLGFHTFGYLRHFRSAVLRLLDDAESEILHVEHGGRRSTLGVYPIGINAAKFDEQLDKPEHAAKQAGFRQAHQGKRIVLSVERMDYTKGILHRLEAVDDFLAKLEDRDGVVFIFVSVPSREGVEEYQDLVEEVEAQIGRLNGKYATLNNSPIHFVHASVAFDDLCALYSIADVALITPLIDGMNLVAKEFLACQRETSGTLILSEFAGAAEELFNAQLVNPYDSDAVAESIAAALALDVKAKRERNRPMRERVMQADAQWWAKSFIDDLGAEAASGDGKSSTGADLEAVGRELRGAVSSGKKVALFLDYDGTLREIVADPGTARPDAELCALLDALRGRANLDVTIISGRRKEDLEGWLGGYPFGLVAEHGAFVRAPGSTEWTRLDEDVDYSWRPGLLKLLGLYAASTPGSFVEEKGSSLVWHYRRADNEFGGWKASQLAEQLGVIAANSPVEIRHGKKIVEISPVQVNKGAVVSRILHERPHDLALCAGDDLTDESMFGLGTADLITIKIGEGPTKAKYRLADPGALRRFLEEMLS